MHERDPSPVERQLTFAAHGHVLTNTAVWSPDGKWIVYDVRSDTEGASFDGSRIEVANVATGEVRVLYVCSHGAYCGVATFSPVSPTVAFILGPENPTADFTYGPARRRGVLVKMDRPGVATSLDARDLTQPFTVGALRGGSHVHVFSPNGLRVSFTYEDHVLSRFGEQGEDYDINQRNIGVSSANHHIEVSRSHPRNHSGTAFSVLITQTVSRPQPGTDEYNKAFEEAWIGNQGYLRHDGTRQRYAIAFQAQVMSAEGRVISEVFVVDLPDDLTRAGDGPLQGTETRLPYPPAGVSARRLTHTAQRKYPGIAGPRHWLRSAPDGSRIAFLMKDDAGVAQIWTISPLGGAPIQLTRNREPIASAFTWNAAGSAIAHVMDNSVCMTDTTTGQTRRLTPRSSDADAPLPLACVFSPNGGSIAFLRRVASAGGRFNQIFIVGVESS